jgi:hypothetical protein
MALERGEAWWLPALYLQRSAFEPLAVRKETLSQALSLARSQQGRALERQILAASTE